MRTPKIERGVPIPHSHGRLNYVATVMYPILRKLEIGDSVEFPDANDRQVANAAYHILGARNYTVRHKRVWRTK